MFTARAGINRNSFILACDCEGVIVLKKIAIVISSMLLGIFGGAAVGWLIGRTIYFFKVELPYRDLHLPPGEFQAATCGLSTSIAINNGRHIDSCGNRSWFHSRLRNRNGSGS